MLEYRKVWQKFDFVKVFVIRYHIVLEKRICFRVFCHINIPLSNDMRYLYIKMHYHLTSLWHIRCQKFWRMKNFYNGPFQSFCIRDFALLRITYSYYISLLWLLITRQHLRILHTCINWLYILFRDIFVDMRNVKTVGVLSMSHLIWITQTVHLTLSTLIIVPYIMRVSWKFSVGERILFMTLLN